LAARLALEFRYYAILLPKLDVMAVDKLLRGFNRCIVVGTVESDRAHEMAVVADEIYSIIGHLRPPLPQESRLCDHKIGKLSARPPTQKVKFDTSQSIAREKALPGVTLTPEQLEPMKIEGWLVDDHVCVQMPAGDNGSWCVSLYPWGDKISFEFFSKDDAIEYAKDVSKLGIDWEEIYSPVNFAMSDLYLLALAQLKALRDQYEADGYFKFHDEPS
jgi:hypothetical protein